MHTCSVSVDTEVWYHCLALIAVGNWVIVKYSKVFLISIVVDYKKEKKSQKSGWLRSVKVRKVVMVVAATEKE